MKWMRSKQYRCIHESTPEEFERHINEVLIKYPSAKMEIDGQIPLLCHAWIDAEVNIPECKADEYELARDVHYCIECPYLDRPQNSNKRQKRFPCQFANYGITTTDSRACDKFYNWYEGQKELGGVACLK